MIRREESWDGFWAKLLRIDMFEGQWEAYRKVADSRAEWLEKTFGLQKDRPVLSLACGEGGIELALAVARECDAAIFVVDGRAGLNAADELLATELRRAGVDLALAVNKVEGQDGVFASVLQPGMIAADVLRSGGNANGLDGIEQGLRPSEATEGNAYEECADPALPRSLDEAIKAAEADGFVRQVLGDMRYEIILEQSRREVAFVTDQVTDIERERYLANL